MPGPPEGGAWPGEWSPDDRPSCRCRGRRREGGGAGAARGERVGGGIDRAPGAGCVAGREEVEGDSAGHADADAHRCRAADRGADPSGGRRLRRAGASSRCRYVIRTYTRPAVRIVRNNSIALPLSGRSSCFAGGLATRKFKSIIGTRSPSATRGIGFLGNKRECQILPPPSAGEFLPGSAHRRW